MHDSSLDISFVGCSPDESSRFVFVLIHQFTFVVDEAEVMQRLHILSLGGKF